MNLDKSLPQCKLQFHQIIVKGKSKDLRLGSINPMNLHRECCLYVHFSGNGLHHILMWHPSQKFQSQKGSQWQGCMWLKCSQPSQTSRWSSQLLRVLALTPEGAPLCHFPNAFCHHHIWPAQGFCASFLCSLCQHTNSYLAAATMFSTFSEKFDKGY